MVRGSGFLLKSAGAGVSTTLAEIIVCPLSKQPLRLCQKTNSLISDSTGVSYPIVHGIPRLVPADGKIIASDAEESTATNSIPEKEANTMTYSVNASTNRDDIFMKQHLQFADSLKDLKNLRKQLYSAADCFESSYIKDEHKQFVVESSRDYVARALVGTVDHLGSVADKLNKFLDENANELSATTVQFSLVEERLNTFQEFMYMRGLSQHLCKIESTSRHHLLPAAEKPKVLNRNCVSSDVPQPKKDNPYSKALEAARMKVDPPLRRKEESRKPSRESSPNPPHFSFTGIVPNKEAGKRSVSPLRFPFNISASVIKRSISPTPSVNKRRLPLEPRRAISATRRQNDEMIRNSNNREKEMEESYTKRSKHLFKALLSLHQSRKEIVQRQKI